MLQKDKRKKTKIIQNDEGEDVEVTDDEAVSSCLLIALVTQFFGNQIQLPTIGVGSELVPERWSQREIGEQDRKGMQLNALLHFRVRS